MCDSCYVAVKMRDTLFCARSFTPNSVSGQQGRSPHAVRQQCGTEGERCMPLRAMAAAPALLQLLAVLQGQHPAYPLVCGKWDVSLGAVMGLWGQTKLLSSQV